MTYIVDLCSKFFLAQAQKRGDEHWNNVCEIHTKCSTFESSAECVDDQRAYVEYLEMMMLWIAC